MSLKLRMQGRGSDLKRPIEVNCKKTVYGCFCFFRTITVLRPVDGDGITEWLRNKSQTELSGLLQQGNPQQLIPYSIALTSQLNQV